MDAHLDPDPCIYNIEYPQTLDQEDDQGNIEYKLKLLINDEITFQKRQTQMKYRLEEGAGEAYYHIGRSDDGRPLGLTADEYALSVTNLKEIAKKLKCQVQTIYEFCQESSHIGEFLVREINNTDYIDLRIGVAGNVDAGKSTTVGTLTRGILDDGRGKTRIFAFNFKHEIDSGRTSSIGHQIMGFDAQGDVVNCKYEKQQTWGEIVQQSKKIITFFDLAGHERYLRTTIFGLTSMHPDYCMIMVGANMGVNHMTREHIGLCLTLKIPFIIVVSKIDIVPANVLEETMKKISNICKLGAKKTPYNVKSDNDLVSVIQHLKSDTIVPIIQISNVNAHNLDLLKKMLNLLPKRINYDNMKSAPVEFLIDGTYTVVGHSTIVSGILKSGSIKTNDNLAIGPFYDGTYKQVKIRSIHCKRKDVKDASAGDYICLSLKNITRKEILKGMVIVNDDSKSKIAVKEFWAVVNILHSPTTVKVGYQPHIHVDQIRQTVNITEIRKIQSKPTNQSANQLVDNLAESADEDPNVLRTGDRAHIKLSFVRKPEYVKPDMRLIFREGKVRAVGKVIENK